MSASSTVGSATFSVNCTGVTAANVLSSSHVAATLRSVSSTDSVTTPCSSIPLDICQRVPINLSMTTTRPKRKYQRCFSIEITALEQNSINTPVSAVFAMTFPSCLSVVIGTFDEDDDVDSCGAAADDDVDSCDAAADDDVVAGESLGVADEAVLTGAGATGSVVGVQAPVSVVDSVVNLVIDDAVVAFSLTKQENYFFPNKHFFF